MFKHKKLKGFSLVELILAIGLFTMAISSFAFLGIEAYKTFKISQNKIVASQKTKEVADAIMLVKTESWGSIVDNTDDGKKYILDTDGFLSIEDGEKQENGFTYFFTIGLGYRDESGNIIELEGEEHEDISSRIIHLTITFEKKVFVDNEYNTKIYVNNWNTQTLIQETNDDFEQGTNIDTKIEDNKVKLETTFLANWCLPQHSHSRFNLPGWAIGTGLTANPGNAYIVTGKIDWGQTFMHAEMSSGSPPIINIAGEYNQERGNDIFVDGNYVYVSTDAAQDSVLIIDITTTPYSKIGSYDTNSSQSAEAIYVYQNYGFVAYGDKVDIFNLSSINERGEDFTGNISAEKIRTIDINSSSGRITNMVKRGDYLFLSMANDSNVQLAIVNLLDTNAGPVKHRVNNHNATALSVSEDGNTAYIATSRLFAQPRFFIINTTNKSAPTTRNSIQINEMFSIADIAIVQGRAILGGSSFGNNNYVVLNIDNPSTLTRCGGMNIPWGILTLDVVEHDGKLFTYILSLDPFNELQVIEGGLGSGQGYMNSGQYLSPIFNLSKENLRFYSTHIYGTEPGGTELKVQFRTGNNSEMINTTWFGPDGTENTSFSLGETEITLPSREGPYFQYKADLVSNESLLTPTLDKIDITYE